MQSLSDEMLKLKSSSEQYEETKENLQNICNLIEKISITHQKVTENMSQFLTEMERARVETQRHEAALEESFSKKISEIRGELRIQTDEMLQQITNQSKTMKFMKFLMLLGVSMEIFIIILIIFTLIFR